MNGEEEKHGYKNVKQLNSGSFGTVFMALDTKEQKQVAIKYINRGSSVTEYVERELMTHRLLWHPHIIKFREVFLTEKHLGIVMEYADGGDLYDYLVSNGCLRESQARWIFQQLIIALDYLHEMGMCNRDIKLENTLLTGNRNKPIVKLCDLGFAKHDNLHSAPDSQVGTPSYFAPEVVENKQYDGKKTDVWSCGVFLYVVLIGQYPFERPEDSSLSKTEQQRVLLKRIRAVDYSFPSNVPLADSAKDLVRIMLVKDPAKRPSMREVMQHPFFKANLPKGVLDMNDKLLANRTVRSHQSEKEITSILREARKAANRHMDLELDHYLAGMDL